MTLAKFFKRKLTGILAVFGLTKKFKSITEDMPYQYMAVFIPKPIKINKTKNIFIPLKWYKCRSGKVKKNFRLEFKKLDDIR
jgi:hypothetical protein